jgi:hypothetical protein
MRTVLVILTFAPIAWTATDRDEGSESVGLARKLVEKAILAQGGKLRIQKGQVRYTVTRGRMFDPKNPKLTADFTEEKWIRPLFFKAIMDIVIDDEKARMIVVVDEMDVKRTINGATVAMSKEEVRNARGDQHLFHVLSLLPLLEEPGMKLTPTKEKSIDGRLVPGVKVECDGKRTVELYFDPDTHLVTAALFQVVEVGGQRREALQRYLKYKEIDGCRYPTKGVRYLDGSRTSEFDIVEIRILERIPPEILKQM